jgi:hypothetical protein
LAEIAVNHHDAFLRPAQGHRVLTQGVLALGALGVLKDLPKRGLPDVEIGIAFQVAGLHFLVHLGLHTLTSCRALRAILVRIMTTSLRRSRGTISSRLDSGSGRTEISGALRDQASIQLFIP